VIVLGLILLAQIAATSPRTPDSVYATTALRDFVALAAQGNHEPPPALRGYRAHVQTELSFVLHDTLGREQATQLEQIAATAAWERDRRYDFHVVGYRAQSMGSPFSALSFVGGWTVPTLYGERLELGVEPVATRRPRRDAPDSLHVVHPLAQDRDHFYRFSGGDTVAILHTVSGDVPIARVHVVPISDTTLRLGVFEGDLDFDATRHALVRLRGRFLVVGRPIKGRPPFAERIPGLVGVAYGDLQNAQLDGEYWLPSYQRTEFQAKFAAFGDTRSVFRLISDFSEYAISRASDSSMLAGTPSDSATPKRSRSLRRTLTYASSDSLSRYGDWTRPLGQATAERSASDFDDLAPDTWRPTGSPTIRFFPKSFDEILRYNRVEGAYTGLSATMAFRDAAPGYSARAFGGWAWQEKAARGGVSVTRQRGKSWLTLRAERTLENTNDFVAPLVGSTTFSAFFAGVDDADYVDRRLVGLTSTSALGTVESGLLTLEARLASDRSVSARLENGPLFHSEAFRPNRASADGPYAIALATLELHPNVSGDFLEPGLGARLHYEGATGDLNWQRAELGLSARQYWHHLLFATHAEGGMVFGRTPPPQTLFELGGLEGLPGYGYKEFGGDRAAVTRALVGYTFPVLNKPHRVWRGYVAPGLSPGIVVGASGGWAEASTAGARESLAQLTTTSFDGQTTIVPRPTDGVRATVDARLTLFGNLIGVGVARPVDHAAPWRFLLTFGLAY
jgi:hypothetical protein